MSAAQKDPDSRPRRNEWRRRSLREHISIGGVALTAAAALAAWTALSILNAPAGASLFAAG